MLTNFFQKVDLSITLVCGIGQPVQRQKVFGRCSEHRPCKVSLVNPCLSDVLAKHAPAAIISYAIDVPRWTVILRKLKQYTVTLDFLSS